MAPNSSRQHATAVLLDDEQDLLRAPTCPLCHASATLTQSAIDAGGDWRCARCGQHWDSARLSAVAAYAAWTIDHDRVGSRGTKGSHDVALYWDSRAEQLGGKP
jgi:ribosomal protein L37AE/L43A